MGNLIKLGEKIISKDKIISAEIVKYTYPKIYHDDPSETNKLLSFFDSIYDIVNHNTKFTNTEFLILDIEYEAGQESNHMFFHNDKKLNQQFPQIVSTYNENIHLINNIENCPIIATSSKPSDYAYACYEFINGVDTITYVETSLNDLLNDLID